MTQIAIVPSFAPIYEDKKINYKMLGSRYFFEPCVHWKCDVNTAILYCCFLAVAFVGSLYVLVPSAIRKLPRDHPTHIQFRSLACLIVCAGAIFSYPYLFCADGIESANSQKIFSIERIMLFPSLSHRQFRGIFGILLHTFIIYIGPCFASLLRIYENRGRSGLQGENQNTFEVMRWFLSYKNMLPDNKQQFWIAMRNYFIAPLTEEIIFRGCMVPLLLASGMSTLKVSLVAPLFFGIAHLHHAATRISNGERPRSVMVMTTFQFLYTSLFGSYASYAFIRSGSVLAVTFSHSYCNWMGLPDLSFVSNFYHPLYQYRMAILPSYIIGICTFWHMFQSNLLLPLPPELPGLIISN